VPNAELTSPGFWVGPDAVLDGQRQLRCGEGGRPLFSDPEDQSHRHPLQFATDQPASPKPKSSLQAQDPVST